MNKKMKRLALLTLGLAFAGTLSLSATNVQTGAADAEHYFKMTDTSIRVPDVGNTDVTTNDNGIRFTAEISKDTYDTAAAAGEVTVGMFILPNLYTDTQSEYYVAEVSEQTCFGNSIKYKWLDDENNMVNANVENAVQIVHVTSKAYVKNEGDGFYTINGSLLHLKSESLTIDFIGCAYIEVNGEYAFATQASTVADNAVNVAQGALLAGVPEAAETAVNDAYVNRYINEYTKQNGQAPTVSVNVDVRKQTSSTSGYVSDETLSKTVQVPFTSYKATTTGGEYQTIENYAQVEGLTTPQTVKFDGSTTVVQNYDYTANKVVLWNGDDKVYDTTSGKTRYYSFAPQAASAAIYSFDNYEDTTWTYDKDGTEVSGFSPAIKAKNAYQGKSGAISTYAASWDGPLSTTAINLPFATDTFSIIVDTNGHNFNNFAFEVFVPNPANGCATYIDVSSYTIETLKAYEGAKTEFNTDADIKTLGAGVHKLIMKIPEKVSQVHGFNVRLRAAGTTGTTWYVDNFCAEANYFEESNAVNDQMPLTYTDKIAFTAPKMQSTMLFPDEIAAQMKVEYQAAGASTWTEAAKTNEEYAITADAAVNAYTVKVSLGDTAREYTVRRGITFATFDETIGTSLVPGSTTQINTAAHRNYIYGARRSQYDRYDNQSGAVTETGGFTTVGTVTPVEGYKGNMLQGNFSKWSGYLYYKGFTPINKDESLTFTKIGVWMYATKDYTAAADSYMTRVYGTTGYGEDNDRHYGRVGALTDAEGGIKNPTITAGYGYYEFYVAEFSTQVKAIEFKLPTTVYIDAVALIA